ALVVAGCGPGVERAPAPTAQPTTPQATDAQAPPRVPAALASTDWRLVEFQSMDDAQGTVRPRDPSLYTMRLNGDGTLAMRLDCNRATGNWSADAGPDGSSGRFEFGLIAATSARCPPPNLDERVTGQAQYVRSYLLRDGRLHLSLMADGGIFVWEPLLDIPFEATPDKAIEAAILRASPTYTRAVVDLEGGTGRGRYVHGRADLNGDGRDEVFVYLLGSFFCGSGGCTLLLLSADDQGGYALVDEFPISRLPLIVAPARSNGWHDLIRPESGGGARASYVRHVFDGSHYVEHERLPADEAPEGTRYLAGELTFERGVALEPGDAPNAH
nr:META domain-containing protein [Vicinamibacterales bacterium]